MKSKIKNSDKKKSSAKKFKEIKVAILAEEPLGWGSGKHYFPIILDGYKWTKNNITYSFSTKLIYDKDVLKGKLTKSNYDVLLVPGGGVGDGESLFKGFHFFPHVKKWKKNLISYIKDGGGYVGICGGATLLTELTTGNNRSPTTFTERQFNKSALGISCIKSYYKYLAIPLFYPFQINHPEKIGATGHAFSFAPGETLDGLKFFSGGIPVDFQILKNNPIFSDYHKDTERIRWWAGSALIIPDDHKRDITILARYPKKDFSKQPNTKIYAWKYIGGIKGLIKGLIKSFVIIKEKKASFRKLLTYAYYLSGNWNLTDKIIELDYSNKVSMATEIYPNKNNARILLCTAHPEYMIWYGGKIIESNPNDFNCLATGLHKWTDIKPLSKTLISEMTHSWWIVRRFVAWTAKIPDKHLPPISPKENNKDIKNLISEIIYDGDIIKQMEDI